MDIDRRVFCVYPDRTGRVWFGTLEGGLGRVDVAEAADQQVCRRQGGKHAGEQDDSRDDHGRRWNPLGRDAGCGNQQARPSEGNDFP